MQLRHERIRHKRNGTPRDILRLLERRSRYRQRRHYPKQSCVTGLERNRVNWPLTYLLTSHGVNDVARLSKIYHRLAVFKRLHRNEPGIGVDTGIAALEIEMHASRFRSTADDVGGQFGGCAEDIHSCTRRTRDNRRRPIWESRPDFAALRVRRKERPNLIALLVDALHAEASHLRDSVFVYATLREIARGEAPYANSLGMLTSVLRKRRAIRGRQIVCGKEYLNLCRRRILQDIL